MKLAISLLVLAVMVCGVYAQNARGKSRLPVPGQYMLRDQQPQPVLLAGAKDLYVLDKGVLARIDAATMTVQATQALFAPLTGIPAQGELSPRQQDDLITARAQRLLPAAMALHGADLVALIGDQFVRVDPVSLDIKVSKPLHADAAQAARQAELFEEPARELVFNDDTLYTLHAHSFPAREVILTAVNSRDGSVLAEKPLPQPLDLPLETWHPLAGGPTFDELTPFMQRPPCSYLAAADGVYVLRCGALAKLDPRTLEQLKVTELYGAVAPPAAPADPAELQATGIKRAQRLLPPAMLMQGNELLIVQGDDFFQVNMATLAVTKHGSLAQVTGDARTKELIALGAPKLQPTKHGVLITRGKECFLLNPATGTCRALPLPESLTRTLSTREKTISYTPRVPKDGEKLSLNAVLWQETGAAGASWHCFSGQFGEFILSGDRLAKIKENTGLTQGMVTVQGVFHKGDGGANAPLGTLELTGDIQGFGMLPLPGTVQKRKLQGGEVWTVSGQYTGEDYVLVGEKVKELEAIPDVTNRQIFLYGKILPAAGEDAAIRPWLYHAG